MELIEGITLKDMNNALYVQFMSDIDHHIKRVGASELKLTKCYEVFTARRQELDGAFVVQRKDNLTRMLEEKDTERMNAFRCLRWHVHADLYSADKTIRDTAISINNKIESYGITSKSGYNVKSSKLEDLGKDLQASPWKEEIETLGRTDNVSSMMEANAEFVSLSRERTEKNKMATVAVRTVRLDMDKAYRDVVSVINSQITMRSLVEEDNADNDGGYPDVQSETDDTTDTLSGFVMSINAVIKEYKLKIAQSGSDDKTEGDDGDTAEPDDKPVVK